MKKILISTVVLLLAVSGCAKRAEICKPGTCIPEEKWELVWADEFSSETIDKTNWTHDIGYGPNDDGWGLWGMQEYTSDPANSFIKDGKLVLKAFYLGGDFQARNYTSAKLTTYGKRSFKYGKVAARIKMP